MTSPQAVQDQVTAYLRNTLGLGTNGIAGVEGNLQIESGFSTTALNKGEGAIGLAQWEKGRRTALQQRAASMGTTETDLSAQLAQLGAELQGPYSGVLAQLRTASSPGQAASIFDSQFEVSAGTSRQARVDAANAIGGTGSIASIGAGTGTASGAGSATAQPASFLGLSLPSFTTIGHWIMDGVVILAGVGLIVAAFVLIAKGGDSGHDTTVTIAPDGDGHQGAKGGTKAGAEDGAEDAAVAA